MRIKEVCCTSVVVMALAVACFRPVVDVASGCQVGATRDAEIVSSSWGEEIMLMQLGLAFPSRSQSSRNGTGAEVQGSDMFKEGAQKQVAAKRTTTNKMFKELTTRKAMVAGSNTQTNTVDTSVVDETSSGTKLPDMGEAIHDGVAQFEALLSNWSHVYSQSLSASFSKLSSASSREQARMAGSVMQTSGMVCVIIGFLVGFGLCLMLCTRGSNSNNRFRRAPPLQTQPSADSDRSTLDQPPTLQSLEPVKSKRTPPPKARPPRPNPPDSTHPPDVTRDVPFEVRSPVTPQQAPRDELTSHSVSHSEG